MTLAEIVVTAGGALLSAGLVWFFFGPKASGEAVMRGGVQEVEVTARGGYSPAIVHAWRGLPLRLVFDRQVSGSARPKSSSATSGSAGPHRPSPARPWS